LAYGKDVSRKCRGVRLMARGAGRRTLELIRVKRLSERLFFVLPGRLAFRLLVLLPFQLSPHSNEFLWRERVRFSFRGLDHISVLRRWPAAEIGRASCRGR